MIVSTFAIIKSSPFSAEAPSQAESSACAAFAAGPLGLPRAFAGDFRSLRAGAPLRFRQLRRPRIHCAQRSCSRRHNGQRSGLGFHFEVCRQLVPADMDFAHAGLPVVWPHERPAPSHQPASACAGNHSAVRVFEACHRCPTAQRLVAFLFAMHPLHVESVAWVAERKDVLSAVFWFLTLWAYVRYTDALHPPDTCWRWHPFVSD